MTAWLRARLASWGLAVLTATLSSFPVPPCAAMDARLISRSEEGGPALLLEGEIFLGDTDRIVPKLLRIYRQGGIPRLILDSPGGNIIDAEKLALLIRRAGIPVAVMAGRMCASACFLLFAASPDRSASAQALIGVHSASLFGDENLLTMPLTMMMAREASNFGVPPDVIGRMVTTKPSDMAWLTAGELREMDVRLIETSAPGSGAETPTGPAPESVAPTPRSDDAPQPQSPTPILQPSIIATRPAEKSEPLAYRPAELALGTPPVTVTAAPLASVGVALHDRTKPVYLPVGPSVAASLSYRPGS